MLVAVVLGVRDILNAGEAFFMAAAMHLIETSIATRDPVHLERKGLGGRVKKYELADMSVYMRNNAVAGYTCSSAMNQTFYACNEVVFINTGSPDPNCACEIGNTDSY